MIKGDRVKEIKKETKWAKERKREKERIGGD